MQQGSVSVEGYSGRKKGTEVRSGARITAPPDNGSLMLGLGVAMLML